MIAPVVEPGPAADEIDEQARRMGIRQVAPVQVEPTVTASLSTRIPQPFSRSQLWLLPILLGAVVLRTQHIGSIGVQFDESFNQRIVEFPWGEMLERIGRDNHPPLFYFVLKIWTELFGNSTGAGRWLSVLGGLASVIGVYAFVRFAYRRDDCSRQQNMLQAELPALVAAALLAMAPLHVFWSMQIRMYSWSVALAVWSSYFLFRALAPRGHPVREWAIYTLLAVLLSYSHYFGLFMLAAQFLYAIGCSWMVPTCRRERLASLVSLAVVGIAWLPWLPYFLIQHARVQREFTLLPGPNWRWLDVVSQELWLGVLSPYSPSLGLLLLQASFIVLVLLPTGRRRADYFIVLAVAVPAIAAVSLSLSSRSIITAKYFLFGHAFLLMAIAVLACRLPRFGRFPAIGIVLCAMFAGCYTQHMRWQSLANLPGMQSAAARIDSARTAEPLIISCPILYCCALSYLKDRDLIYNFQPPGGFPYWQGTAVLPQENKVDVSWIRNSQANHLWTVEADGGFLGRVNVPDNWSLLREETFPEWYGTVIVRLYGRT